MDKYRGRVLDDRLINELNEMAKAKNPDKYGLPIENGITKEFIDVVHKYYLDKKQEEENNSVLDGVKKCAFDCDNPVWEKGASYCKEHMECDDWS